VPHVRPETVAVVLDAVATRPVPLYTPYSVTALLSVEAVHESEIEADVVPVVFSPDGVEGAVVSGAGGGAGGGSEFPVATTPFDMSALISDVESGRS
jgi:hypothetical protein